MKRIVALLALSLSASVYADPYRHYHYHHSGGGGWIAPLIIGGAVGYAISRPPVIVQQPPVVVNPPPVVVQNPVPIYQEVLQYNTDCQCYVKTYQQIGWK